MTRTITISRDFLLKALADEIARQSAGVLDAEVISVQAIIGHEIPPAEIYGVEVEVRARQAAPPSPTLPGFIRLAATEGVRL